MHWHSSEPLLRCKEWEILFLNYYVNKNSSPTDCFIQWAWNTLKVVRAGSVVIPECRKDKDQAQDICCLAENTICTHDKDCCPDQKCMDLYGGKKHDPKWCSKPCLKTGTVCQDDSQCCGALTVSAQFLHIIDSLSWNYAKVIEHSFGQSWSKREHCWCRSTGAMATAAKFWDKNVQTNLNAVKLVTPSSRYTCFLPHVSFGSQERQKELWLIGSS